VVIVAIIIILSARATFSKAAPGSQTLATAVTSASPDYQGAEFCGNCHADKYEGWNQTAHAHAIMLIQNASGNFYSVGAISNLNGTPSSVYNEAGFRNSCRNCHTTGGNNWDPINNGLAGANRTWPEMATDPAKFLNIQCEVCHGAYQSHGSTNPAMIINATIAFCMQCHANGTTHDNSHWLGPHGAANISCVTCHDPHSGVNVGQLRYAEVSELCGQCHLQAEVFSDSAHSRAGLECVNCHGQGTQLSHGATAFVFNHTWAVYGMYYPYNQTRAEEPIVCSNCHTQEWATTQLGVIQDLTTELMNNVTQVITNAKATIIDANQTSGVDPAKITSASTTVNAAQSTIDIIGNDKSMGFHNPEKTFSMLGDAARLAGEAQMTALTAKAEALGENLTSVQNERLALQTQISSLQAQVSSLQNQTTTLQSRIDSLSSSTTTAPYLYGGVGLAIGFVVGAAILFAVRKRKQ